MPMSCNLLPALVVSEAYIRLANPKRRLPLRCAAAADSTGLPNGSPGSSISPSQSSVSSHKDSGGPPNSPVVIPPTEPEPATLLERVKRFFTGSKLDKARLAALGFGAFSAYGVISNINAGILITIAWLTVVRTTGLTPLDGTNWSRFAAIYAGLWIGSNFLRPLRLTLALAAAPLFDAAIGAVSRRTGLPRVPAFVVMLLCIAVATTSTLVATIAVLGGFPPGCRLPWQLV